MHRKTFTRAGLSETLCSLAGTNPPVSPRRSGQLSDHVPPLLCVTSEVLFDITAGSCLALGTELNSVSGNNQGENVGGVVAGFHVCCYFASQLAAKTPAASPKTKSTLMWQALWGRWSSAEALVLLKSCPEKTKKGQKLRLPVPPTPLWRTEELRQSKGEPADFVLRFNGGGWLRSMWDLLQRNRSDETRRNIQVRTLKAEFLRGAFKICIICFTYRFTYDDFYHVEPKMCQYYTTTNVSMSSKCLKLTFGASFRHNTNQKLFSS